MAYDIRKGSMKDIPKNDLPTIQKAIIYCRVSDKQQVTEGHGLE